MKLGSIGTSHSPPNSDQMKWGASARTAPISPSRQAPHIDRSKVNPEILKAAEGMEMMFLDYMMQVMRKTVPKNEMDLESPATEIYRGMLDSQYAEKAAHQGGIGLADQIIAYLESQGYHLSQGPEAQSKEKP